MRFFWNAEGLSSNCVTRGGNPQYNRPIGYRWLSTYMLRSDHLHYPFLHTRISAVPGNGDPLRWFLGYMVAHLLS